MPTTKFPLVVVFMELAHQITKRRVILRAEWLPRLQNEEADALTNMDFGHFDMSRRVRMDLDHMEFGGLNVLFGSGKAYPSDLEAQRAAEKARKVAGGERAGGGRKRRAGEALSVRDLWK